MQQQITQWWNPIMNEVKRDLVDHYFPSEKLDWTCLDLDKIVAIYDGEHSDEYPSEHQEKSYTIEKAVEHLKNGGAIEADFDNIEILKKICLIVEPNGLTAPTGKAKYYYAIGSMWIGNGTCELPTIKLSQITSDNAVKGKQFEVSKVEAFEEVAINEDCERETLEQTADRFANENGGMSEPEYHSFIAGAKWQSAELVKANSELVEALGKVNDMAKLYAVGVYDCRYAEKLIEKYKS